MTHRLCLVRRFGQVAIVTATTVAQLLSLMAWRANAQPGTGDRSETVITFENRLRRVFGTDVAAECGDEFPHSAPFGNWGVNSNGGRKRNGFQFAGWHKECTAGLYCDLRQWNSCTARFPPPHPKHYNDNGYTTQKAHPDSTVGYGQTTYRGSLGETCESQGGVVWVRGNYMDLWDWTDSPTRVTSWSRN